MLEWLKNVVAKRKKETGGDGIDPGDIDEKDKVVLYPEIGFSYRAIRPGTRRPEVWLASAALRACGYDVDEQAHADKRFVAALKKFQIDSGLKADGWIGSKTYPILVGESKRHGFTPPLERRCQALSCQYETGRVDAYGMAENDIGDGAGANYGIVQHNKLGSMRTLLLKYGDRQDLLQVYNGSDKSKVNRKIKAWCGSPEGVKAQDAYFISTVYDWAVKQAVVLSPLCGDLVVGSTRRKMSNIWWERLVAFLVDTRIQNGSLYSSGGKPFWRTYTDDDPRGFQYRELYEGKLWDQYFRGLKEGAFSYVQLKKEWTDMFETYKEDVSAGMARRATNRDLFHVWLARLPDNAERQSTALILLAQWRARCSSSRWWYRVWQRRSAIVTGAGRVQGSDLDMVRHFGVGTDFWSDQ